MIYQTYQKQVEAWKERFCIKGNPPRWIFGTHLKKDLSDKDLLLSRHKDTIELIEAIIKEVEGMKEGGNVYHDEEDERYGYNQALSDLLTKLQAEKELLENNK